MIYLCINVGEDLGVDDNTQGNIVHIEERRVLRIATFNVSIEKEDLAKVIENEL